MEDERRGSLLAFEADNDFFSLPFHEWLVVL